MPLQATSGAASYDGFGGGVPFVPAYIEEVFSTSLYTGNGSTQTINNGIDLAGKGGLVWLKERTAAGTHLLYDTARGNNFLASNTTGAQGGGSISFTSTGFSEYFNAQSYATWTFRKQPKFFDVVTWTGNGTQPRTITHNLGSVPGCIIVKRTDSISDWAVYHRAVDATTPQGYRLELNTTNARVATTSTWNDQAPTSTEFYIGSATYNANGGTYVAYLFAHNAGGFGLSGADNVISCGSFTQSSGSNVTVNLGYEPQLLLYKRTDAAGDWVIADIMRGMAVSDAAAGTGDPVSALRPNSSGAEVVGYGYISPTATGFVANIANPATFIYLAIRRPNKPPTSGTQVYNAIARTGTGTNSLKVTGVGFSPDMVWPWYRASAANDFCDRLRGPLRTLRPSSTAAETTQTVYSVSSFDMDGYTQGSSDGANINASGQTFIDWFFRRAPGFFDVVCYTGTGSARTVSHNLGVVPELMIVKRRNSSVYGDWYVYTAAQGATKFLLLNLTDAVATNSGPWNNTAPTSSVFTAGSDLSINSTATYVAYLFATVAGVSKVGSYTGTGTTKQIDCGFTGGARFVLIKRTDSTGDWYVWDSARGIVAGSDPYLTLNTTAAEVTTTDWVDTYSAGFELSNAGGNNVNINGAAYIFLSVA